MYVCMYAHPHCGRGTFASSCSLYEDAARVTTRERHIILALRLELVIAYQGLFILRVCHSLVCVCPWFGTVNTRGQRISASIDIGGAA